MAYKLLKPYTDEQRMDFIVQYNHNRGLKLEETTYALFALAENEIIVDGEVIIDPKYEERKKLEEQEKLAKTYMTKWDFVKYILNPHNFTYAMLKEVLSKDVALEEAWECCSYVYRGDDTLCTNLPKLLPTVTTEFLDEAFKEHRTYGG